MVAWGYESVVVVVVGVRVGWGGVGAVPPRIMGAMGAAQAAYGQAGLPAGAPAVELVTEITQPLKEPIIPPLSSSSLLTPPSSSISILLRVRSVP